MRHRRQARGYSLLEMVVLISLMGVFLILGSELWRAATVTTRNAKQVESEGLRLDMVLDRLRRDVWAATHVHADAGRCQLHLSDGRRITWRVADGHVLSREELADGGPNHKQAWPVFASGVQVLSHPVGVQVTVTPTHGLASQAMVFPSPGITKGDNP